MRHAGRIAWTSIISNIVVVIILVLLFTLPGKYLSAMTSEMDNYAADAVDAALNADWPRAISDMTAMEKRFDTSKQFVKLFLNHEDIDELEALVAASCRLAQIQDDAEMLIQLERIRGTLKYLEGIETFDFVDLF